MNPGIGDLLKLWLAETNSEWKHTCKVEWTSNSGTGSAESPSGFIVHPLSQHLEEVLWVNPEGVANPLYTKDLNIADPDFFEQLQEVLDKAAAIFRFCPDRNSDLNRNLTSWVGPIDYTGPGRLEWASK